MSPTVRNVLEVLGLLLIVGGLAWWLGIPAGLMAAGVACLGISYLGGDRR